MASPGWVGATLTVRLEDFPASVWALRHRMAELLLEEAAGEPEFVQRFARRVSAEFECGVPGMEDPDHG